MNDDLERRLQARLHEDLPTAPAATRAFLERLPVDHPRVVARRGAGRGAVTAVLVGIGLVAAASMAGLGGSPEQSQHPLAGPTIHTVSELLDLRADGRIGGEPVALRGFWSDRGISITCLLADPPPGELEIRCRDGQFGITERDEPFGTITVTFHETRFQRTDGPALTPFVEGDLADRLFDLPYIHGQPYLPVPIVVVGHFDDPRAADCRPEFRQRCRDRLVLDEIVEFHPEAVATPGVTPSPTPFPFAEPPPAPFTKADCFGDIPYSFIGWGSLSGYGIDLGSDEPVFIMVPRDEVRQSGSVARWLCWAHEGDSGFGKSQYPIP